MKSYCATARELDQALLESASSTSTVHSVRHVDRIAQTIECGILVFIVLLTLLGNYATHSHLMSGTLIP